MKKSNKPVQSSVGTEPLGTPHINNKQNMKLPKQKGIPMGGNQKFWRKSNP